MFVYLRIDIYIYISVCVCERHYQGIPFLYPSVLVSDLFSADAFPRAEHFHRRMLEINVCLSELFKV